MKRTFCKEIFAFIVAGFAMLSSTSAQVIFNGYGSYVLKGGYNAEYGTADFLHGRTCDGLQWGAGVEYLLSDKYGIEGMYLRRNTRAFQQSKTDPQKTINFNLALNYIMAGLNGYLLPATSKLQPYGSMLAGVVVEQIDFANSPINSSITKVAWAVRLGGKYWISQRVGLRLQAQWTSFFIMDGGLPDTNVYGLNTADINFPIAYQFEVGSGVMIKLNRTEKD
jgi:opacity protein-like surface antigen